MPRKVLLITADQFRFDHLGCTGHPLKPTPNLDRLAAESSLFLKHSNPITTTIIKIRHTTGKHFLLLFRVFFLLLQRLSLEHFGSRSWTTS